MTARRKKPVIVEYLNPRFGYFYTVSKTLYRGKTRHQNIEILDTPEFGVVMRLDGITQVVTKNDYQYHEPLAHTALCCHPSPRRVLIIGGGDGGILRETVKYPAIHAIDVAELDEAVVRLSKKYFIPVHRGAFDDPRVRVHICDGRKFVEKRRGGYDVIIMDMTDPFGPSTYLYTREFFRAVNAALRDDRGVFAMHTESPVSSPATFNSIVKTLRVVFGNVQTLYMYIQMYAVLWSVSVCSGNPGVTRMNGTLVDRRLSSNGIRGLNLFSGKTFEAMKVAYPYIEEILRTKARVLTDRSPGIPDVIFKRTAASAPRSPRS